MAMLLAQWCFCLGLSREIEGNFHYIIQSMLTSPSLFREIIRIMAWRLRSLVSQNVD